MEAKPNSVQVPNKSGTFKRFTSLKAPGVDEWRNSVDKPKGPSREERAAQRAIEKQQKAEQQQKFNRWLMNKVEMAMGSAMDGLDPMDTLASTMDKYNLDVQDIDNLMKKNGYKHGLYQELAIMWDETQQDQIYDAQHGHIQDSNQFYTIRNGQVIPTDNPFK
jgi:hypothetical protein